MESAYLSVAKIAEMTGLEPRTVTGWCKTGKLKSYQPGGKNYLIKREDFEEFMEASKVEV